PDLSQVMPVARLLRSRQRVLNQGIRESARRTGAVLADLEDHALGLDLRYWHSDRLHGSPHGHAMLAGLLAAQLGLPVVPAPLAGDASPRGWRGEVGWAREHLLDYVTRHARGIKLGDGITAKRPALLPVEAR
ncbi:MAG: lipolytic protein family, partial [Frankiales bacterium]|nr:lipolytic protein family [Frankiales bacterium]